MKKGKKLLNTKLKHHMVGPHAFSHEVYAHIHILMILFFG